jgi:hypothetical protein
MIVFDMIIIIMKPMMVMAMVVGDQEENDKMSHGRIPT